MKEMQTELRKFVAPELMVGPDARRLAARYAKNFGAAKVLVVTDPGIIAAGWTKEITDSLEAAEIPYHIFSDLVPNPRAEEVMAGAEVYERNRCDTIVVIGGGSAIDCAKGIGIVSANAGHILDFEGVDQIPSPGPPIICIPTTGGSSADVSQFAIITDTKRELKVTIISKMIVPDVSLLDPLVLTTMPGELTANTGMDALAHAIESFVSNAHSPITDLFALEAVRLMSSNLVAAIEHPADLVLRSRTLQASLYAGLAFSNAGLGLIHAMAHSLGGYLDIPHGACNALLMSRVVEFNFEAAADRFTAIGEALGLPLAGMNTSEIKASLLGALERLRSDLKLDLTLGKAGVKRSDIAALAAKASNDPCVATNPRRPAPRDIEKIYEDAL